MTSEDHHARKRDLRDKAQGAAASAPAPAAHRPALSSRQKRRRIALLLLGGLTFLFIIGSALALFPDFSSSGRGTQTTFDPSSTGAPTARRSPVTTHSPQASSVPEQDTPAPDATIPPGSTATITGPSPTSAPGTTPTTSPSPTTPTTAPQLSAAPLSLQFSLTLVSCLTQQPSQTVVIQNTGGGMLTWQASLQNTAYLSIAPTNGILGPSQSTTMTVLLICKGQLSTTDTIYLTSNGGNLTISVTISLL